MRDFTKHAVSSDDDDMFFISIGRLNKHNLLPRDSDVEIPDKNEVILLNNRQVKVTKVEVNEPRYLIDLGICVGVWHCPA